jgi:hypothetical protein
LKRLKKTLKTERHEPSRRKKNFEKKNKALATERERKKNGERKK